MTYVRCINNQPYLHPPGQPIQVEPLTDLIVGQVYKIVPDASAERRGLLRVIDESFGEAGSEYGYLYPSDYFEPFVPKDSLSMSSLTIHIDEFTKGVLHAEAVASDKSISALLREWIDERLDLPTPV